MTQSKSSEKLTPMMKQYFSIKEKYPDTILFYRMGDFYEMFFEDARIASPVLEITLTSRNKNDADSIPMCGIPAKAVDSYLGKLIEAGHKVAICEQVEDPATAKGLVKRDVVRIITPGMIMENELLDAKTNNYVLSVYRNHETTGLSWLDISTGTFKVCESGEPYLIADEIKRIAPSEIIFPETYKNDPVYRPLIDAAADKAISFIADSAFDTNSSRERLAGQFNTQNLNEFGCENHPSAIAAAGALLYYVAETQKQKVEHLAALETYQLSNYLLIDENSCRNLELLKNIQTGGKKGSLLSVLDQTVTAMGGRMLKSWVRYPLTNMALIQARLDAVSEVKKNIQIRRNIRTQLKSFHDLERLASRMAMKRANARDLLGLKNSLTTLPDIFSEIACLNTDLFHLNDTAMADKIQDLYTLADIIEKAIREDAPPTITEGGMIKTGFNKALDELIAISRDGKSYLAKLENEERQKTGITSLKVRYNKVFGYYIEVSKNRSSEVPEHYVRKQTLVNAERYITDELKTFEAKVLNAQDQRSALENSIFNDIREKTVRHNNTLQYLARFIAQIDCLCNLAEIADLNDYSKPTVGSDGVIDIQEGRHPVVEKLITGERYVPNNAHLNDNDHQILIITGPNMAGKSTVLRQVALTVLMTQMGSFVPAEKAVISITDKIFTRVGALDNLSSGQSTFMVEMEETANILYHATQKSLVIIDEIGRGTSTFDGLSIAWAVAEYLHDVYDKGVKTLFATHYHELTQLADSKPRVKNFNIAVKEWNDEIIFLRKLVEGGTNRSYGIQVARLAGLPESIILNAKKILLRIESSAHTLSLTSFQNTPKQKKKQKPKQLSLFRKPEEIIIENLKKMDISTMTPIDALNCLNGLKEKAQDVVFD